MRKTPLKRKTPLRGNPETIKAWKNRTAAPLSQFSRKRKTDAPVYSRKRNAFLSTHAYCQALVPGFCTGRSEDVHHKAGRTGTNYLDEETWLATCRRCHDWIHEHPNKAREKGLLE
jgi:hypothetical protein